MVRRLKTEEEKEPPHQPSPTALVAEALRTGVKPVEPPDEPPVLPGEEEVVQVGDPDVDPLYSAYVGDETPGGTSPTPDQDRVDDIGRAYGVLEEDSGALRTSAELLDARDRRRALQEDPDPTTRE